MAPKARHVNSCVCSISNALIRSPFIGCLGRWSPALQQAKTQTRRHRESQIRDLEPAQADVHLAAVLYGAFQRERRIRFKSFQIISNPIFHFKSKPTYTDKSKNLHNHRLVPTNHSEQN